MIRRNRDVSRPHFNQSTPKCANRRASYLKTNLAQALRAMAPALFALTFASVANAQGTMDFSGAQTLMGTFQTFAIYAGAVTVDLDNGSTATYDPRRLRGVNVYRESTREFATGDRIQFTAPDKKPWSCQPRSRNRHEP